MCTITQYGYVFGTFKYISMFLGNFNRNLSEKIPGMYASPLFKETSIPRLILLKKTTTVSRIPKRPMWSKYRRRALPGDFSGVNGDCSRSKFNNFGTYRATLALDDQAPAAAVHSIRHPIAYTIDIHHGDCSRSQFNNSMTSTATLVQSIWWWPSTFDGGNLGPLSYRYTHHGDRSERTL